MEPALETEDLTSPDVISDPYTYFGGLREEDPVHWNPLLGEWIVTRHADVVWLIRQHELFSSADSTFDPSSVFPPIDESDWGLANHVAATFKPFTVFDRPEHLAMRQTIHRWFTPRAVEKWRGELKSISRAIIRERLELGSMEAKTDFAMRLPLTTISWMLNIPADDASHMRDLAEGATSSGFEPHRHRSIARSWQDLQDYFGPLIEAREKEPGEDLISMLAEGKKEGIFTHDQCVASISHLMIAGHVTTMSLICSGLLAFIRHPDQWRLLQRDPRGFCASATEECLRYEPPIKGTVRVASKDVQLGNKLIQAGDRVFWVIASANRDPRVFSEPDALDITRSPNPHVAFGGGIHHCIGAALARVEVQEAFVALAELLPQPYLDDEQIEYVPTLIEREIRSLNVSW